MNEKEINEIIKHMNEKINNIQDIVIETKKLIIYIFWGAVAFYVGHYFRSLS